MKQSILKTTPILLLLFTVVFMVGRATYHPLSEVHGVYIHPEWSSCANHTTESTFELMACSGINTIFVDAYYPTEAGKGIFLAEKKGPWIGTSKEPEFANVFFLDETIQRAKKFGISVHVTISCFGELPAIDPADPRHRLHLKEITEYILANFPSVDGIHLDYVRYLSEWGLSANGNTEAITSFIEDIRESAQHKLLSAAVIAVGDQEEYESARFETGQDCRDISQYLDFICPMAYHMAFGKRLEWVGAVSRFTRNISRESCKVFPTVQAYYKFEKEIAILHTRGNNTSVPGLAFEVPSIGTLQFDVDWQNPKSRFLLVIRDSLSREVTTEPTINHTRRPNGETYVLKTSMTGTWETELKVNAIAHSGDTVSLRVSDVSEELPGYHVIRGAISMAMTDADGFCVYALNNLSSEELRAISDSLGKPVVLPAFDMSAIVIDHESLRDTPKRAVYCLRVSG